MNDFNNPEQHAHWSAIMADWQQSGLSETAYCAAHQLSAFDFLYWQLRFEGYIPKASLQHQ